MTRIANSFEGGTDGVAVSTVNSGGASGDAFSNVVGGGTHTYNDDAPLPLTQAGLMGATLVAASATQASFTIDWTTKTEVWCRGYYAWTAPPGTNTSIMVLAASGVAGVQVQLMATGAIRMRDAGSVTRYTSPVLASNTPHRLELHVVHSATLGRMELRIYSGANVDGDTPNETIGSAVTNWNTAANSNSWRTGVVSSPGTGGLTLHVDDLAIDDTGWIGSAYTASAPTQLATPTGVTVTPAAGLRQLTVDWSAVANADDGYNVEVQRLVDAGDPDVEGDWVALDIFPVSAGTLTKQLTDADGIDWGKTYRARVQALTTDDNA